MMSAAVAVALLAIAAHPAQAAPVDPSTLTPQPPNATCHTAGLQILCRTEVVNHVDAEQGFELPCGTFYETLDYVGRGLRWYSADGFLTKRTVFEAAHGYWTLSPDGTGPRVYFSWRQVDHNTDIDPFAPESDWPLTISGLQFKVQAADGEVLFIYAGHDDESGHHGVGSWLDLESSELICAALTA